jgi:hypothetical protein
VSKAKEQMQDEKNLRDVVLEQIENTVLETDKELLREEAARHSKAIKKHRAAVAAAKVEMPAAMATIFSTTANFFRGDSKTPWDNIVHGQTKKDPWTNLRGEEQSGVRGKTMAAWQDCYTLMLKTVFTNNVAAEKQKFYLTLLRLSYRGPFWGYVLIARDPGQIFNDRSRRRMVRKSHMTPEFQRRNGVTKQQPQIGILVLDFYVFSILVTLIFS